MAAGGYGPEAFAAEFGLDDATLDRFRAYAALLEKWQARINLIGPATVPDLWRRHFQDSAQLAPLIPPGVDPVVDLGSGAGFPGLVLAMMGLGPVHLIDSDAKKIAFLRDVSRETRAPVTLHAARFDAVPAMTARAVTARAVAPLPKLLGWMDRFAGQATLGVFLKGQNVDDELTETTISRYTVVERRPSLSDPRGQILCVRRR